MSHRFASLLAAAACAALLSACASQQDAEDIGAAAQAACTAQGLTPGPQMNACLDEMRQNIQAARAYRPERPQGPPPGQHH